MRICSSVFAVILLLVNSAALAASKNDAYGYGVTIDPPTGSIHCGFGLSGNIKTPKAVALAYGFFFRSELNIVTPLDRGHPIKRTYLSGPETLRVTGQSREFQDDSILQKHKLIQVQLRIWYNGDVGNVGAGGPQTAPILESAWIDIPLSSPRCATDQLKPVAVPSLPTSSNSTKSPIPVVPAPHTDLTGTQHQIIKRGQ